MAATPPDDPSADQPIRQYRFTPPPGACDLLLVRHGESQPAVAGQAFPEVDGHADPPLDPEGEREAEAVADRLEQEEVAAIYTTGLTRTRQTAAPLAARLGIEPVEEPLLREVHLGEWDGGEYRIRAAAGDPIIRRVFEDQDWRHIPGAESMATFCDRIRRGIDGIAARHPDQRVVAVVHGGVIGAVMHLATGSEPFAFVGAANASLNHIVIHEGTWIVRRFNDTGHLPTDLDKPVQALI
jgi:2,3-bisphosphoglycerate-dependent phosphoglycerate mutase